MRNPENVWIGLLQSCLIEATLKAPCRVESLGLTWRVGGT